MMKIWLSRGYMAFAIRENHDYLDKLLIFTGLLANHPDTTEF